MSVSEPNGNGHTPEDAVRATTHAAQSEALAPPNGGNTELLDKEDVGDKHALTKSANPEIFIGLVGAMGTNLEQADAILKELLRDYRYHGEVIRISRLFEQDPRYRNDRGGSAKQYYDAAITKGNELRAEFRQHDALAQLAIREISRRRGARSLDESWTWQRRAFVVHSLKLRQEVDAFRKVYGDLFYCIAVYSDETVRLERMRVRCNEFTGDPDSELGEVAAKLLIHKDEHEDLEYGQDVRNAFVEADYYIRSDDDAELRVSLGRFLSLVFDQPYISPTRSEVAMMHAKTAALRSADLSRQIGATVVSRDGRILTTGCNEVPRPGGGQYWDGDLDDARDFRRGFDANDRKKREATIELIANLNDYLRIDFDINDKKKFAQFYATVRHRLKGTRIDNIVEFGRIVHAEMAAMNAATLDTISIRDADIYCTTFPCHMCTRQIVNVGIRNVFYIEPYAKSAAKELYEDSVDINPRLNPDEFKQRLLGTLEPNRRVAFIPFSGVAPRRYHDLFTNKRRKDDDGNVEIKPRHKAVPRRAPLLASYLEIERSICERIEPLFQTWRREADAANPPTLFDQGLSAPNQTAKMTGQPHGQGNDT